MFKSAKIVYVLTHYSIIRPMPIQGIYIYRAQIIVIVILIFIFRLGCFPCPIQWLHALQRVFMLLSTISEIQCDDPPEAANATLIWPNSTKPDAFYLNHTALYQCHDGARFADGYDTFIRFCQSNRLWTPFQSSCECKGLIVTYECGSVTNPVFKFLYQISQSICLVLWFKVIYERCTAKST